MTGSPATSRFIPGNPELQHPQRGALIRRDIGQLSNGLLLRRFLAKGDERFVFVLDADPGLALAFVSAFALWSKAGRVDIAVVSFDKHQSNDSRNALVADGRAALESRPEYREVRGRS